MVRDTESGGAQPHSFAPPDDLPRTIQRGGAARIDDPAGSTSRYTVPAGTDNGHVPSDVIATIRNHGRLADPAPVPQDTWAQCAEIARFHGRTFYFACQFLPPERRRAIHAIYAFCRIADDIVDRAPISGSVAAARALDDWEAQIARPTAPIPLAFAYVRARYGVPDAAAYSLIEGLRMDLLPRRYATWEDLSVYCYRVAGTVGEMAAPVLGCRDPAAIPHAIELGIAMQLTNILRDVAEDTRLGRLYLPEEDLAAFGCNPEAVLAGCPDGRFPELIAFEIDRARAYYASAARGLPALSPAGRLTALAGSDLYAHILTRIEDQQYDVFRNRASVSTIGKLRALPGIAGSMVRLTITGALA